MKPGALAHSGRIGSRSPAQPVRQYVPHAAYDTSIPAGERDRSIAGMIRFMRAGARGSGAGGRDGTPLGARLHQDGGRRAPSRVLVVDLADQHVPDHHDHRGEQQYAQAHIRGALFAHLDRDLAAPKTLATSTPCLDCHAGMEAAGSRVKVEAPLTGDAVGYVDAMHGLCVGCHEQLAKEEPAEHPADFPRRRNCHRGVDRAQVQAADGALLASRAWGLAHLDELAQQAAGVTGVAEPAGLEDFSGPDYGLSYKTLESPTSFLPRLSARGAVPKGAP